MDETGKMMDGPSKPKFRRSSHDDDLDDDSQPALPSRNSLGSPKRKMMKTEAHVARSSVEDSVAVEPTNTDLNPPDASSEFSASAEDAIQRKSARSSQSLRTSRRINRGSLRNSAKEREKVARVEALEAAKASRPTGQGDAEGEHSSAKEKAKAARVAALENAKPASSAAQENAKAAFKSEYVNDGKQPVDDEKKHAADFENDKDCDETKDLEEGKGDAKIPARIIPGAYRVGEDDDESNSSASDVYIEENEAPGQYAQEGEKQPSVIAASSDQLIQQTVEAEINRRLGVDSYVVETPAAIPVKEFETTHAEDDDGDVIYASAVSEPRKICGIPYYVALILLAIVVIGAIVGGVLGAVLGGADKEAATSYPTPSPTIRRFTEDELLEQLRPALFNRTLDDLQNAESPQSQALKWLSTLDNVPEGDDIVDRFALAVLFFSFGVAGNRKYIRPGVSYCEWNWEVVLEGDIVSNGMECDEEGNIVNIRILTPDGDEIDAPTGEVPAEVALLTDIELFQIQSLRAVGTLPTELGLMTNLVVLDFIDSTSNGTLPTELGLLVHLEHFIIGQGRVEGKIPSEYGNMIEMRYFDVSVNRLTGSIPDSLSSWTNLEVLWISDNRLTGTLPTFFGNMTNMERFEVEINEFIGTLPTELGLMDRTATLLVFENSLSGNLPSEIGLMKDVYVIDACSNGFVGTVPTEFAQLTSLEYLLLQENSLTGDLDPIVCVLNEVLLQLSEADCKSEISCSCCSECYADE